MKEKLDNGKSILFPPIGNEDLPATLDRKDCFEEINAQQEIDAK